MDVDSLDRPVKAMPLVKTSLAFKKDPFKSVPLCCDIAMAISITFLYIILFLARVSAIPITQLVVGSLHKNDCSINHMIPKYLIFAGAAGIVMIVLLYVQVNKYLQ